MRQFVLAAVLLGMASGAAAQEQTLIKGTLDARGFGEAASQVTWLHDQASFLLGGRGGLLINRHIVIGGAAYWLVNSAHGFNSGFPGSVDLRFGYGGFHTEYIFMSNSVVHFNVSGLVGGGTTFFVVDHDGGPFGQNRIGRNDGFFVFEPGAAVEVNVTPGIHVSAGIGYRVFGGLRQSGVDDDDLAGPSAVFTVKFLPHR